MKKILTRLGIALVALAALLAIVGLTRPSKWRVERSVVVKAKPETIMPLITDLKNWKYWVAWNKAMDPSAVWTFDGNDSGVGAKMSWKGDKLGEGTLEITKVEPNQSVHYTMVMEGGTPAEGSFVLAPEKDGIKTTWTDSGDVGMNLPARFAISSIEEMLGQHFQMGLDKLKEGAEKAQANADAEAAAAAAAQGAAPADGAAPPADGAAPPADGAPQQATTGKP